VYASESILKSLFEIGSPATVRARNLDIKLPARVPRIFTGNAESVSLWLGSSIQWSLPLQRKSIYFQVSRPLCSDAWRANAQALAGSDAGALAPEVSALFAEVMPQPPPALAPPADAGVFRRAIQGAVGRAIRGLFS